MKLFGCDRVCIGVSHAHAPSIKSPIRISRLVGCYAFSLFLLISLWLLSLDIDFRMQIGISGPVVFFQSCDGEFEWVVANVEPNYLDKWVEVHRYTTVPQTWRHFERVPSWAGIRGGYYRPDNPWVHDVYLFGSTYNWPVALIAMIATIHYFESLRRRARASTLQLSNVTS
ncbi:MAG: hypothetical protein GC162_19200 [Planctomycetes bacterium]|nr:hypothetical protein [Planctomycetota bacterium]